MKFKSFRVVLSNLVSVKIGVGQLSGLKVVQLWFIDNAGFDNFLKVAGASSDQRFSPHI